MHRASDADDDVDNAAAPKRADDGLENSLCEGVGGQCLLLALPPLWWGVWGTPTPPETDFLYSTICSRAGLPVCARGLTRPSCPGGSDLYVSRYVSWWYGFHGLERAQPGSWNRRTAS